MKIILNYHLHHSQHHIQVYSLSSLSSRAAIKPVDLRHQLQHQLGFNNLAIIITIINIIIIIIVIIVTFAKAERALRVVRSRSEPFITISFLFNSMEISYRERSPPFNSMEI